MRYLVAVVLATMAAFAAAQAQTCGTSPTIFAYNFNNDHLLGFSASAPGTIVSDIQLTGINAGESLAGLDFRPANGQLYSVASDGTTNRVVTINTTTGVVTAVGGTTPATVDIFFGADFNPVVDRLRVIGDARSNRRLNPDTGALVATDTTLAYATGDPGAPSNPHIVHVAYDRNVAGATLTTLFGIDDTRDTLVRIGGVDGSPSPNGGQVTTVGALGFNVSSSGGFDIQGGSGTAYAVLRISGVSTLYTINLSTGAATSIGAVGGGPFVDGIAVGQCGTVASASVSGRVTLSDGRGLRNATVTMTDQNNVSQSTTTSTFGFYQFDGVATGQTYTVSIGSRLFTFTPRSVPVSDTLMNVDFVGQ